MHSARLRCPFLVNNFSWKKNYCTAAASMLFPQYAAAPQQIFYLYIFMTELYRKGVISKKICMRASLNCFKYIKRHFSRIKW